MKKLVNFVAIVALVATCGCRTQMLTKDEKGLNWYGKLVKVVTGAELEQETNMTGQGVDPETVPLAGEWTPDPQVVLYEFGFGDGTLLRFREHHAGDYWGAYPTLGWGEIQWPDGTTKGIDVNSLIRHGTDGRTQTPVTTLTHGKRYFWMAGENNKKRITIFEDGWNPNVESAVLVTQQSIGIASPLSNCETKVER